MSHQSQQPHRVSVGCMHCWMDTGYILMKISTAFSGVSWFRGCQNFADKFRIINLAPYSDLPDVLHVYGV